MNQILLLLLSSKGLHHYQNLHIKYISLLLGNEIRLIRNSTLWLEAIKLFKDKYDVIAATSTDLRLIDMERAIAYLNTDKPQHTIHPSLSKKNSYLILPVEEPTITSIEFAENIELSLKVIHETIRKYKVDLEAFGPLPFETAMAEKSPEGIWIHKDTPNHFRLNEQQAYFLATLSRNTPKVIEFKKWLVNTFFILKNERVIDGPMKELLSYFPGNWEGLIQTLLCHLSSFTEQPFRQEVKLNNMSRVDILMSDTEALEIKNHIITPCHIKNLIINKAYWFQLKEQLPKFETLYLTSTKGITEQAYSILQPLKPEIQYISLSSLFQRVAPNKDLPLHLLPSY